MWNFTVFSVRNTTKIVEHKLVSLATVIALWTLVTLLMKLIRILLKWKYMQEQNYAILAAMLQKQSYFVPVTQSVHMGKFSSLSPRSRNRASPASHMNIWEFLKRKEWRGEISETEPARLTALI